MKKILTTLLTFLAFMQLNAQSADVDFRGQRQSVTSFPAGIAPSSSDAANPWIQVGPWGGNVVDLGVNPEAPATLFAAAGLPFISTDGGDTWSIIEQLSGFASGSVNAIEGAASGVIIATGLYSYGKIFRSPDGGVTWQSKTIPVSCPGLCIAADPNDTNTFFVGLASNTSATLNKVIAKSVNGGVNWTVIDMTSILPLGWSVESLCIDPGNSQTIFAVGGESFSNAKLVASFDGGATWEDRTGNLPPGVPFNHVNIAGGKVYVAGGQLFGSQDMGVYMSTDYGLNWTDISTSFPIKVANFIAIDPNNDQKLFAATEGGGIYSSTNGGNTWNYTTNGAGANGAARTLLFLPGSSDTLLAGYLSIAVTRSYDGGTNWDYANTGIATLTVNDVEISKADPAIVLAGFEAENSGGCFISMDSGSTWSLVTGLPGTRFSKVGSLANGDLVAWSNGPTTVAQEGLYKSTDNGVTWTNKGPFVGNLFETEVYALATSDTGDIIYVGGNNFGVNGWKSVIWKSPDGGDTWEKVYLGPDDYDSFRYLFIDPQGSENVVYAAMKSETQGGILKTDDGGGTWTNITESYSADKMFSAVVTSPPDYQKVIAGMGGYGTTGTAIISPDAGSSWSPTNLSLDSYSRVQDIAINPSVPDVVYAASAMEGPFFSTDGGWQWAHANEGIIAGNITGFSTPWQTTGGWDIFASTYGYSVYKTTLYDPAQGIPVHNDLPLLKVTPNPSHGNFTVMCIKDKADRLAIYNSLGICIGEFKLSAVNGQVQITTELPAGLYYLQATSNGQLAGSAKAIVE